jgi:uncharacterized protein YcbK (DUF882 family)
MQLTKNFTLAEFQCKDAAGTQVPDRYAANAQALAVNLQAIRDAIGEPLHVVSGYRTPAHNRHVGGAKGSQHMYAKAADISARNLTPKQLHAVILRMIRQGLIKDGGVGLYPSWVHYDIGPARRW